MENDQLFEDRLESPPPRKKKKKRTLKRILRGFGRYLAEMPAKTLIMIGGSIVIVIVAVVLLVVLLPKGEKAPVVPDQLSIQDAATPSPTLPPIATPGPTEVPTPTPGVTIKEGGLMLWDVDDVIASIQERLVELGYMDMPEGGYTTKYGPATKNGVRRFQMRNFESYKDWDGVCGQKTYDMIFSETAAHFYMKSGDSDDSLYDGELVTKLQKRLVELGYMTGSATGKYGQTTVAAVTQFQTDNGILNDGAAGQATLSLLYSTAAVDAATAKLRGTPAVSATGTPNPNASSAPATTSTAPTSVTAEPSVAAEPVTSTAPAA